ncbi:hypothetical protein FH972_024666 [Carpinus fangiana]|uniref:AB hydrolase-1 domain-containing protein n=1 Tax=Carpinus fangiana TaxID=176857 RepID=A0A5N6L170_9ROSI|nr:hypothetical protein FH972_024666 [Carpinus fangiana]
MHGGSFVQCLAPPSPTPGLPRLRSPKHFSYLCSPARCSSRASCHRDVPSVSLEPHRHHPCTIVCLRVSMSQATSSQDDPHFHAAVGAQDVHNRGPSPMASPVEEHETPRPSADLYALARPFAEHNDDRPSADLHNDEKPPLPPPPPNLRPAFLRPASSAPSSVRNAALLPPGGPDPYEKLAQKNPKPTDHLSITLGPPVILLFDIVVPCIIYYVWYDVNKSHWQNDCRPFRNRGEVCPYPKPQYNDDILGYAIISFGFGELYILIARVYRLLAYPDLCAPLLSRNRWELDATSWVYAVAMIMALVPFVVGSTLEIPELYLYSPAFLMAFLGIIMVATLIPFKTPVGINSHARGTRIRPFIYYAAEDFIAVDGLQDREFRVRYNARYDASKSFRRLFVYLTVWWIFGVLTYIGCLSAVIWTVEFHIAFGLSLGVLFSYIIIWAGTSYWWVQYEMDKERKKHGAALGRFHSRHSNKSFGATPRDTQSCSPSDLSHSAAKSRQVIWYRVESWLSVVSGSDKRRGDGTISLWSDGNRQSNSCITPLAKVKKCLQHMRRQPSRPLEYHKARVHARHVPDEIYTGVQAIAMLSNIFLGSLWLAASMVSANPLHHKKGPTCTNIVLPVEASATHKKVPDDLLSNLPSSPEAIKKLADGLPNITVSGTWTIHGRYCKPEKDVRSRRHTLQYLVHGATYTRDYWSGASFPGFNGDKYSWVAKASKEGYPTLSIDRLGNGESTHPDPILDMQYPLQAAIYSNMISKVRQGAIANTRFDKVALVCHSLGSLICNTLTTNHPEAADVLLLSSVSTRLPLAGTGVFATTQASPAAIAKPDKFGSLAPGYLYITSYAGREQLFYERSGHDPKIVQYDFDRAGTLAAGEAFSGLLGPSVSKGFKGPVYVVNGQEDTLFCSLALPNVSRGDCTTPTKEIKPLYPAAKSYQAHNVPATGHVMNLHYSAQKTFHDAHKWLCSVGL